MRRERRLAKSDAVLLIAGTVVALSVTLAIASRPDAGLDDRARAIEAQLRCPTCQGLSIADSPSTSATQMRALVREQLLAGASDEEAREFFVARYGRWILLDPPVSGTDLILWFAPAVILAGGAALVTRRARAGRAPAAASRAWASGGLPSVPRAGTLAIVGAMVLALALPIAVSVGPRLVGAEVSGRSVSQPAPSIEDLEAFIRAEPRDVEALVGLGDALLAADRTSEATDRYKAALVLEPDNVGGLLGIGTILLAADRPDAAGPVFDRILVLSPHQPDALLYRAVARLRLAGSPTDAVRRDVERFLVIAPRSDPRRAFATGLLAPTPASSEPVATSAPAGSAVP